MTIEGADGATSVVGDSSAYRTGFGVDTVVR